MTNELEYLIWEKFSTAVEWSIIKKYYKYPFNSAQFPQLGRNICFLCSSVENNISAIPAEEQRYIEKAGPIRKNEFSTARVLSRKALSILGVNAGALVPDEDRCPKWPPGIVGSISHSGNKCVVAVARRKDLTGIGIDIEHTGISVDRDLMRYFCTTNEISEIGQFRRNGRSDTEVVKAIFSMKESVYKCIYPIIRRPISLKDIEINFVGYGGGYKVNNIHGVDRSLFAGISGRWGVIMSFVLSFAFVI